MPDRKTETKSIAIADLKRGVSLRTGRDFTLVVSGITARRDHYVHHRFVSAAGAGLPGLQWRLVKDGRELATGTTDSDGHVSVKVPDAGDYHLELVDDAEPAQGGKHPETVDHEPEPQEIE